MPDHTDRRIFARFERAISLRELTIVLNQTGIEAQAVEVLDANRRELLTTLFPRPVKPFRRFIAIAIACIVTILFGLLAVIVDNVGYSLSLLAAIVLWSAHRRPITPSDGPVFELTIKKFDAGRVSDALLNLGATGMIGPLRAE